MIDRDSMKKNRSKLFLLILIVFSPNLLFGRIMGGNELLLNIILAKKNIAQFRILTKVRVFDPFTSSSIEEKNEGFTVLVEKKENAFEQEIIFVRDEFLSIETKDKSKLPLHFFIMAEGIAFSKNLSDVRMFQDEDIKLPFLFLLSKSVPPLVDYLNSIGIIESNVSIKRDDIRVFYQLGTEESHLIVDPELFRIELIQQQIQYNSHNYPLRVKYSKWDSRVKFIPRLIQFMIDDRLFKEVEVTSINYRGVGAFKRKTIQKYKKILPSRSKKDFDLMYGQ